jgi:glutaredoxin-like protein NrdH
MSTKTVSVYTQPGCQPCKATKRWLDQRGLTYTPVDVSESPADLAAIKALGYVGVPVVVVSNGDPETDLHWHGFHPDNMTKYILGAAS